MHINKWCKLRKSEVTAKERPKNELVIHDVTLIKSSPSSRYNNWQKVFNPWMGFAEWTFSSGGRKSISPLRWHQWRISEEVVDPSSEFFSPFGSVGSHFTNVVGGVSTPNDQNTFVTQTWKGLTQSHMLFDVQGVLQRNLEYWNINVQLHYEPLGLWGIVWTP